MQIIVLVAFASSNLWLNSFHNLTFDSFVYCILISSSLLCLFSIESGRELNKCRSQFHSSNTVSIVPNNTALVTLTSGKFITDLIALSLSLEITNPQLPLICLVSSEFNPSDLNLLRKYCTSIKQFSHLQLSWWKYHRHFKWHRTLEMVEAVNKIQIWRLNELPVIDNPMPPIDHCLYVDSDCIVQQSIEEKIPSLKELSAVTGPVKSKINSGVLGFQPSNDTFTELWNKWVSGSYPRGFGDQGLIGTHFYDQKRVNFIDGLSLLSCAHRRFLELEDVSRSQRGDIDERSQNSTF
ncbi:hypothetical protein GEMRC1_008056 [Eukaryota sp. GEM-RC1]